MTTPEARIRAMVEAKQTLRWMDGAELLRLLDEEREQRKALLELRAQEACR